MPTTYKSKKVVRTTTRLKKGDEVIVIAGKDKGRRGKILRVIAERARVVVGGVQMIKKHVRANPNANVAGGIVEKEAPLAISNVAIFNSKTKKADRISQLIGKDGKKKP